MARILTDLNSALKRMTTGEKRFANRLDALLEDDYLVWFDIPAGKTRRYTDFIIFHPARGLLFLEVKDWKLDTLKSITPELAVILEHGIPKTVPNPLHQARQCAIVAINQLQRDPLLKQSDGLHQGKLVMPWGFGVVFSNITRAQLEKMLGADGEHVLPGHLLICRDEMTEAIEAEVFQSRLWGMFTYQFGKRLDLPQIDRVRWHLFPEIRIADTQQSLPGFAVDQEMTAPDIIKVMDLQQEQLARSLGEGHRVIHGVAGSGKTLILAYRCEFLSSFVSRPILVLCFNIPLATRLRAYLMAKGVEHNVHVYHFHEWCGVQLKTYHVDVTAGEGEYFDRQVTSVINAVDCDRIPRAQYDAVLIDEGHDFKADWLKLVVQMVNPDTNALLLLYDDAQSIYQERRGLDFSLSSVGIQARGRSTVLRLNYRNTREILSFAYRFAKEFLPLNDADDDHVPLLEPQLAGVSGDAPVYRQFDDESHEVEFIGRCVQRWYEAGEALNNIAIVYCSSYQGALLDRELKQRGIPCVWLGSSQHKRHYDPSANTVVLMTRHSSKGLEFDKVIVCGLSAIRAEDEHRPLESRLLYVAMTRARKQLLVTCGGAHPFAERLAQLSAGC